MLTHNSLPFIFFLFKFNKYQLKFKSNNLARVRKQNCNSFASFGFERWLVGHWQCAAMWVNNCKICAMGKK